MQTLSQLSTLQLKLLDVPLALLILLLPVTKRFLQVLIVFFQHYIVPGEFQVLGLQVVVVGGELDVFAFGGF